MIPSTSSEDSANEHRKAFEAHCAEVDAEIQKCLASLIECPGCAKCDQLEILTDDSADAYVQCQCGWRGPTERTPEIASLSWNHRTQTKPCSKTCQCTSS